MVRIATWNLQGPELTSARLSRLKDQMAKIDADIWIQTESHIDANPGQAYEFHGTKPLEGNDDGQRKVIVWSRMPVRSRLSHEGGHTAIAIEVLLGDRPFIVAGTVIPYELAGGEWSYQWYGKKYKRLPSFQLHHDGISKTGAFLTEIRNDFPNHNICIAGDFNQARCAPTKELGRLYGSNEGRVILNGILTDNLLKCVTECDYVADGRLDKPLVDHICLSHAIADGIDVGVWQREPGTTDHNGVVVTLPIA